MNETQDGVDAAQKPKASWIKRLLPFVLIAIGFAAAYVSGIFSADGREEIAAFIRGLDSTVAEHFWIAVAAYVLFYAVAVSFSVPGALWFTIGAGFLFGQWVGTGVAVIGATAGASIIFLVTRYALADWAREKFSGRIEKLRAGFQEDAFNYVLLLRLIPVFPFFVLNVGMALLSIPLRAFVLGSFIGMIPGAFVYASFGAGGARALEQLAGGETPGLSDLVNPPLLIAMIGLGVLAILPIAIRKIRGRVPGEGKARQDGAQGDKS